MQSINDKKAQLSFKSLTTDGGRLILKTLLLSDKPNSWDLYRDLCI